ncbi:MAG: hypothetical protein Q8R70_10425 [Methanoregula sp.]|nr:hypothetical protein [Methanoregula sp.]
MGTEAVPVATVIGQFGKESPHSRTKPVVMIHCLNGEVQHGS